MSASIYWQPMGGVNLNVGLPSRFVQIMIDTFGPYPWNITAGDANKLRLLGIGTQDDGLKKVFNELAKQCENHEQIQVYPVY